MSDFTSKYEMAKKVGAATVQGFGHVMSCAASTVNVLDGTIDDIYSVSSNDSDSSNEMDADDATWTTFGEHTVSDGTATLNTLEQGAATDESGSWTSAEENLDDTLMSYDESTFDGTLESKSTFESHTTGGSTFETSERDGKSHMGYSTSTVYSSGASNSGIYEARTKDSRSMTPTTTATMSTGRTSSELSRNNSMIRSVSSGVSYKEQLWLEAQEQLQAVSYEDSAIQQDLAEFTESEKRWLTEAESEVGTENIPRELLSKDFMKRLADHERLLDDAEDEAAKIEADRLLQLAEAEKAAAEKAAEEEREAERLEEEQRAEREAKEKLHAEQIRIEQEKQVAEALRESEAALAAVDKKLSTLAVEDPPATREVESDAFDPPGIKASAAFDEDPFAAFEEQLFTESANEATAEPEPATAVEIGTSQIQVEIDNEEAHADDEEVEVAEIPTIEEEQPKAEVEVGLETLQEEESAEEQQQQEEEENPVEETQPQRQSRYHEIVIDTTKPSTLDTNMAASYDIKRGHSNTTDATVDTAASWSSSPLNSHDEDSFLSKSGHNSLSFSGHGSLSPSGHGSVMTTDAFHNHQKPTITLESIQENQDSGKSSGKKKGKVKKGLKRLFGRREKNPAAVEV